MLVVSLALIFNSSSYMHENIYAQPQVQLCFLNKVEREIAILVRVQYDSSFQRDDQRADRHLDPGLLEWLNGT